MLLKRMGIELGVFEACNGKQALEYLTSDKNTGIGHIDILITDVKMPFMDGIELIKNVMHNDISLKTIIFSGYNEFEYAKLAVKLGVKDYSIYCPVEVVQEVYFEFVRISGYQFLLQHCRPKLCRKGLKLYYNSSLE